MKEKKVISSKNLPTRSPILSTLVYVLALSYWNAPQWVWGAIGVLLLIIWVTWIASWFLEEDIDIMSSWQGKVDTKQSFADRIKDAMEKEKKQ